MTTLPESMMIPASELAVRSKVRLEIVPDLPAIFRHFAARWPTKSRRTTATADPPG